MKPMKCAADRAGETHESAAQREGLQTVAHRILAERHRGALVFADRPQHPAPGTARKPLQPDVDDPDDNRDQRQIGEVIERRRRREAVEGTRDEGDAESAAGQFLCVERDELHDDGNAEGRDREVVRPQPQRQRADESRDRARSDHGCKPADEDRQGEAAETALGRGRRQKRRSVCADGDETGDADIEQSRLPPLNVEAKTDERVDERQNEKEARIGDRPDEVERHVGLPARPVGRTSSTAISTRKAKAARHSEPTS